MPAVIVGIFSYIYAMTIAIDFDGTIVEHRYPHIGKEIPFAVLTLKTLAREGHKLILWTVREGELLDEAVEWCRERGLEFFAVNRDFPDASDEPTDGCRKLRVDMFIDDRNLGGIPDWGAIYEVVHENLTFAEYYKRILSAEPEPEPSFWQKLFGRKSE